VLSGICSYYRVTIKSTAAKREEHGKETAALNSFPNALSRCKIRYKREKGRGGNKSNRV
jgi:hypothetical protein